MVRLRAAGSSGFGWLATAERIRALTAGASSEAGPSSTMCRICLPLPLITLAGSGSWVPRVKKTLTQRGNTATDMMTSEARSLGPNPIASAL